MAAPSAPHHQRARPRGYTLLELLIVVVLGGLVLAAISTVILSQVRLTRNQLLAQQSRSDWSRFTYFLANEVGEGCQVYATTTASANDNPICNPANAAVGTNVSDCTSGAVVLFVVVVPIVPTNLATPSPDQRNIYYTAGTGTNAGTLFRCGPPILQSGRLDSTITTFTKTPLLSGIPITATVDANNVSVTLTPSITGANISPFAVRTRSILIP